VFAGRIRKVEDQHHHENKKADHEGVYENRQQLQGGLSSIIDNTSTRPYRSRWDGILEGMTAVACSRQTRQRQGCHTSRGALRG
jgi:hypothetical protein